MIRAEEKKAATNVLRAEEAAGELTGGGRGTGPTRSCSWWPRCEVIARYQNE